MKYWSDGPKYRVETVNHELTGSHSVSWRDKESKELILLSLPTTGMEPHDKTFNLLNYVLFTSLVTDRVSLSSTSIGNTYRRGSEHVTC